MTGPEMLALLSARRSVRRFTAEPVPREVLERLLQAATAAPSASNRQPWRFVVVRRPEARAALAEAVRQRVDALRAIVARGHHRDDLGAYPDFFHEPLAAASAIVVPTFRTHDDLLAQLVRASGEDPEPFDVGGAMQSERCATAAACMSLLVQAEAEGLGAIWMAGPMIARQAIEAQLGVRAPYRMLGAIALGWPDEAPEPKPRRPLDGVVRWIE